LRPSGSFASLRMTAGTNNGQLQRQRQRQLQWTLATATGLAATASSNDSHNGNGIDCRNGIGNGIDNVN